MWRLKALIPKESGSLEGKTIEIGNIRVQVHKTIAQGGFSFVYLVKDALSGRTYALKHIIINDRETQDLVKKEIQIMQLLQGHPNVVCLHSHAVQDTGRNKECFLLLDYCDKMLVHVMDNLGTKGSSFDERTLLVIFRDVCTAVYAMHTVSPPIAHRDLKAENVLLGPDGVWKLCDFGSCSTKHKRFDTAEEMSIEEDVIRKHTTPAYRAPEMWDLYRREYICEKVDIWALGCLLFRMAFFKSAFDGESKLQILNGNYRIPDSSKYSANVVALIRDMLAMDQSKRPDITQIWRRVNDMLPPDARKQRPERAPGAVQQQQPPPQPPLQGQAPPLESAPGRGAQPLQPSRAPPSPPTPSRSPPPPPPSQSSDTAGGAAGGAFWAKFGGETTPPEAPRLPAEPERLQGSPPSSPPRRSSQSEAGGLAKPAPSAKSATGAFFKKTGAADLFSKIKDKAYSATERLGGADTDTAMYLRAGEGGLLEEPASGGPPPIDNTRSPSPPPPSYSSVTDPPSGFNAFAADFNGGAASLKPPPSPPQGGQSPPVAGRHSRGPSGGEGAGEVDRMREELKRVMGEKAELADRCHKLEVIVRAQQQQITELQAQVVNSPIKGVVLNKGGGGSSSTEPAGWKSFSDAPQPLPGGGSFWDSQEQHRSATSTRSSTPPPQGGLPPQTGSWHSFEEAAEGPMGSRKGSRGSFAGGESFGSPAPSQGNGEGGFVQGVSPMTSPGHSNKASPSPLWDPPGQSADWQSRKGAQAPTKGSTLDPFSALSQLKM